MGQTCKVLHGVRCTQLVRRNKRVRELEAEVERLQDEIAVDEQVLAAVHEHVDKLQQAVWFKALACASYRGALGMKP